MKKIVLAIAVLICSTSYAQDKAKPRIGTYVGVSFGQIENQTRSDKIKSGWKYAVPIGAQIGADLTIPAFNGFFVKPGIFVEYLSDYTKKETIKEGEMRYLDTVKYTYYYAHYKSTDRSSYHNQYLMIYIPASVGYRYSFTEKISASLGFTAFSSFSILNTVTTDTEYIYSSDVSRYNKHTHNKDTSDLMKGTKFSDNINGGIGTEMEFSYGRYFARYSYLFHLKNADVNKFHLHNITFGISF